MRNARVAVALAVLGTASLRAQQPKLPADVEELLWWLPPDSETLQVTQTPANPRRGFAKEMQPEIAGGDVSYAETLTRHLRRARIKATIDGSRRFAAPSGLGDMLYEGALIVHFEKPLGESGSRLMADLQKSALHVDRFDGLTVVEFRDKLESDTWASYIAIPRSDVLVIATDRGYLEELLRRRHARTGARAFPGDLLEWPWLDVSAPFWALRHYRHDAPDDPTSPFGRRNDVVGGFDAAAIGVTAHVKTDGRTIEAHYLSRAIDAEQIATRVWSHPGDGVTPAVRRVGSNVIGVRFVAKDEEDLSMFFFYLMAALGHATYL